MGEAKATVYCQFCSEHHRARFLCNPAKQILEKVAQKGMSFDCPTVDFSEPVEDAGIGFEPGDLWMSQVVVMAATCEVAGGTQPLLIFTGRDLQGLPLPRWMYAADDERIIAFKDLVASRVDLAVQAARSQRPGQGQPDR